MTLSFLKRKKKRRSRPTGERRAQVDFYDELVRELSDSDALRHPTRELYFRARVDALLRKRLSTRLVRVLEALYRLAPDPITRSRLARKSLLLQRDYLNSFKEYSDRALIRLAERENLFDKWEGFYILAWFGGKTAKAYLVERLNQEEEGLLRQVMEWGIGRIELNLRKRAQERGF